MSNGIERNSGAQLRNWLLGVIGAWMGLMLCACSGGGPAASAGGGGGISGTGARITTTGVVTGFGSVIVAGVHYTAKPDASVRVEGKDAPSEADLQPGMTVVIKGSFDSATSTGSYESIEYRSDLKGPAMDVNPIAGSFFLLGHLVTVDAGTVLDGLNDIADLANGAQVEVSGTIDPAGKLRASRVFQEKVAAIPGDPVRLKGKVSSAATGTIIIGSQQVHYTAQTIFVNIDASELNGMDQRSIEVTGILSGATILAARIERLDALAGALDGERVHMSGIVQSGSVGSFVLNSPNGPVPVVGSGAGIDNGLPSAIQVGARVEVAGILTNGSLIAGKITLERENTIKLEGLVARVDLPAQVLTVNGISGTITDRTIFRDRSAIKLRKLNLAALTAGDHVQTGGYLDTSVVPARVVITRVERFAPSVTTFIQGPVSELTPQLVILGVTIVSSSGTSYRNGDAILDGLAAFVGQVAPNSTIVKAKGNFSSPPPTLTATELEIHP